jgi:hypothetical protein
VYLARGSRLAGYPCISINGNGASSARNPGGGLIVMPDVSNDVNRELIIALAARYSVPAIYFNRFFFGTRRPDLLW